jgi:hypothetical protein
MNAVTAMLTGTGLGCLAMYALDPETGRTRRALARDKMTKIQKKAGEAAVVTARDLKDRTLGTLAEGRSLFERSVDDAVLVERVRSRLGYLVRYPSSIHVHADGSRVFLSGSAFADECEQLIHGMKSIRGVREVDNRLQIHERAEDFPGLQGELKPRPTGRPIDLMPLHWSPSAKFLVSFASLIGLGVLAYGLSGNGQSTRRSHWYPRSRTKRRSHPWSLQGKIRAIARAA